MMKNLATLSMGGIMGFFIGCMAVSAANDIVSGCIIFVCVYTVFALFHCAIFSINRKVTVPVSVVIGILVVVSLICIW